MPKENSHSPHNSDVAKDLKMVWSLESGMFDSIECANCGKAEVSVWFTNPTPNEYRTWFVCGGCGYESKAVNAGKPKMFRADRLNAELQAKDEAMVRTRKFPPPKI